MNAITVAKTASLHLCGDDVDVACPVKIHRVVRIHQLSITIYHSHSHLDEL